VVTSEWTGPYQQSLSAGGGWLNSVRPGDHVFLGSACGEPAELIAQLLAGVQSGAIREVTAYQMMKGGDRCATNMEG